MSKKTQTFKLPDTNKVSIDRKEQVEACTNEISSLMRQNEDIHLVFVCTHNSRRSQACELWAQTWIHHLGLKNIHSHSAGTEKTAFNHRMIDAARRWGFSINSNGKEGDALYHIMSGLSGDKGKTYFSKTIHNRSLPESRVIAIMTCAHADDNCPYVPGALTRTPLRYTDPSRYDGQPDEHQYYDRTFTEIGREIGLLLMGMT